jgi:NADPH2:quinone reductase
MKAMIIDDKRNFVWSDVPDPVRKADEVLIKVAAAAVNRADLMQKDGLYASPPDWPQWCGLEASGVVLEAPANSSFKAGDKVCALLGGGGYSEMVTVPAGMVVPIPEGLSMVEAGSLPEVWCTVYLNLMMEAGGMKPGDVFYMQAGASGVGLAAIQFAKLMGAKVITTIDSPEKAAFVKKLGADFVLDYRTEDVRPVIEANPPTVALDCIGGKLMGECFKNMVFGGRWIMIATMGGAETTINLETVWRKRIRLIGSTLRSRTSQEKADILKALQTKLWPHFTSGKLITNIHSVFPMQQADEAHGVLRRCENIGKVVLTLE